MKCPNCNRVIEDHSVFCEYCGHKIKKSPWPWIALVSAIIIGVIVAVVINNNHKQLANDRREDGLYNNCQTAADYRHYLSEYPDGRYAAMARNKVEELKQDSISHELDLRAAERNVYENCISQRDCKAYLEEYPRGEFVPQVRQMLDRMQQDSLNQIRIQNEARIAMGNTTTFPYNTYFTGTIGSRGSMTIDREGGGSYTYDLNGTPLTRNINLKSYDRASGQLIIESYDLKGKYIGQFDGYTSNDNSYSGTFTNYKGGTVSFHLYSE